MIEIFSRFFNKKNKIISIADEDISLPFHTDIHSHLIPGIDDGSENIKTSIALIKRLYDFGYRKLIITPHVIHDSYNNKTDAILIGLEKLQKEIFLKNIDIELAVSAEYYLDEELLKRVKNKDILTISNKYLLFETSYYNEPINLEESIYEIQMAGYIPILAHPERYRFVNNNEDFYNSLKEKGVLFQSNISSFGGYYGKDARNKVLWLSKNGLIDFLGTDLHKEKQLNFLKDIFLNSDLFKIAISNNKIKNDTL